MTKSELVPKVDLYHTIEGARIVLKPAAKADFEELYQLYSDRENMQHLTYVTGSDISLFTKEDMWQSFEKYSKTQSEGKGLSYHVFLKGSGKVPEKFLGCTRLIELELENKYGSVGIITNKSAWSNCYATEILYLLLKYAFEDLRLHRIVFETLDANLGMRGWCEKVAKSELESIQKDRYFDGEKFLSFCTYPLFGNNWKSTIKPSILAKLEKVLSKDDVNSLI